MIVAIATVNGGLEKSLLADNLATLRTRVGRKVLLIDIDPQQTSFNWRNMRCAAAAKPTVPAPAISGKGVQPVLENLAFRYDDYIIDTQARDRLASSSALVAARIVNISLREERPDVVHRATLAKRIDMARLFNPGLKVMFVRVYTFPKRVGSAPTIIDALLATIPSATLASVIIHNNSSLRSAFAGGLPASEYGR